MNSALRLQISSLRFGFGMKPTEAALLAINGDARNEFVSVKDNAERSSSTVLASAMLVLQINASRHITQICEAIIGALSVDMVNILFRPFASHVEPRKAVGVSRFGIYLNLPIPAGVERTGNIANLNTGARSDESRKNASLRAVMQKFAQSCSGQHFSSGQSINFTS